MCKVASGIDSQVLGEQEIFGQFKTALKSAKEYKIVGKKLSYFADKVIEISSKVKAINFFIALPHQSEDKKDCL